jgi:hypothetical protein
MGRETTVSIQETDFLINGRPTYEGRTYYGMRIEGLLLNSRMVQGIFDDLNPKTRSLGCGTRSAIAASLSRRCRDGAIMVFSASRSTCKVVVRTGIATANSSPGSTQLSMLPGICGRTARRV